MCLGGVPAPPGLVMLAPLKAPRNATLREHLPWVTTSLYPTASDRGECILAMLFWVLAALAVVGALAIVWGLYVLVRRWL